MALAFGLRLYGLGAKSMHGDEVKSHWVITHPDLKAILKTTFIDRTSGRPPLYYVLMHLYARFAGADVWALRLPSVLWGSLCVPLGFLLLRRFVSVRAAWLGAALLAAHPYFILPAQEIRDYAWLMMFALASTYVFLRLCLEEDRRWPMMVAYVFSNLAMTWTHHYGWLVAAAEGAFWLWACARGWMAWRSASFWFTLWALLMVLSIPALYEFAYHFGREKMVNINPNPMSLPKYIKSLGGLFLHLGGGFRYGSLTLAELRALLKQPWHVLMMTLSLVIPLAVILFGNARQFTKAKSLSFFLGLQFVLTVLVAGVLMRSAIDARHMAVIAPAYALLLAIGIDQYFESYVLRGALLLWLAPLLLAHRYYYALPYHPLLMDNYQAMTDQLNRDVGSHDVIVTDTENIPESYHVFRMYYHGSAPVMAIQVFWRRYFVNFPQPTLQNAETVWVSMSKQSLAHPQGWQNLQEFSRQIAHPNIQVFDFGQARQWQRLVRLTR